MCSKFVGICATPISRLETRPTSRSERLVKEALVDERRMIVPPIGIPTQIAKEAGVVQSVKIAD